MPTEIIDLCDSSDSDVVETQPTRQSSVVRRATPIVPDLRAKLRDSERARNQLADERIVFSKNNSRLEAELAEARRRIADLEQRQQPSSFSMQTGDSMQSNDSHTEIIRCLNHDLERVTALSAENYMKYQGVKRQIGNYKSAIDSMWAAVECPVCFEPAWEPVVYDCGHLVCQGCAVSPACAHCRAPTRSFTKVYAMRDIVRTISPLAPPDENSPKKTRR